MGFEGVHAAAAEGDDQELRKCLEGLDIDRDGLFDRTDPQPRVIAGSQPGTHGRYNHPVSVGTKGSCGDTPLHKAAAAGQATSVAYIMSLAATGLPIGHGIGEDSGIGDHRGQGPRTNPPPWEVGTEENAHVQRVREPNAIEILVAARNDAGETALHMAALNGNFLSTRILIDSGSDIQAQDAMNGWTPLHYAARRGSLKVMAALLQAGANPNAVDYLGGTALHVAARFEVDEAVSLLCQASCDLDLQRRSDGYTALHVACRWNRTIQTVEGILEARADPALTSRSGHPPAYIAATLGSERVLNTVAQAHYRLCVKNEDGEGLSRLKEGGQLTARAGFDKAMQRLADATTMCSDQGGWYKAEYDLIDEWLVPETGEMFTAPHAVTCGKWVGKGPLDAAELDEEIRQHQVHATTFLKSKVGMYTPDEKIEELIREELTEPALSIRSANTHWREGRAARIAFDFRRAERSFNHATRQLEKDWWGTAGAAISHTLAEEMRVLKDVRTRLDDAMFHGDSCRTKFDFLGALEQYTGADKEYSEYGDSERALESLYRQDECRRKAGVKEEADALVRLAHEQMLTSVDIEEYPHSRIMLTEAAENFSKAMELYLSYNDRATARTTENRLKATTWDLERQSEAYERLRTALVMMIERTEDLSTRYDPSKVYGPILFKLRVGDVVTSLTKACSLISDIGDKKVHPLATALLEDAIERNNQQNEALAALSEAQAATEAYTWDDTLREIVVFGVENDLEGRKEPYRRHAIHEDYKLKAEGQGVCFQRLTLKEGMQRYIDARELFVLVRDEKNRAEAALREEEVLGMIEKQSEAHNFILKGQTDVRASEYAAAILKYRVAEKSFEAISDQVNREYLAMLVQDAMVKRGIFDEAKLKLQQGKELVVARKKLETWQDVVETGLEKFKQAQGLFNESADLFDSLDENTLSSEAQLHEEDAVERRTHAEELLESIAIIIQPGMGGVDGADMAPRRDDKYRRTMGYPEVEQAITDAAVTGRISTYHEKGVVQAGSEVHLKAGHHVMTKTIHITRNVTLSAEDEADNETVSLTLTEDSLMIVDAQEVILDSLTLNQKLGDGLEDYWSGGLFVLKVIKGTCVANDCVFYSQRGSGVVVTRQGNAVLERCTITECGHYGIGADGPSVVVDCRQTSVKDCKFEDCDSRNGARIVGIDDFAHVVDEGHDSLLQE